MAAVAADGASGAPAARFAVRTLGCKVNRAESDAIVEALAEAGLESAEEAQAADVILINSCTVTGEADAKTRKAVRHALAEPQAPIVIVTGCLAALEADALRALGERVVVVADKARVAEAVLARGLSVAGQTPGSVKSSAGGATTRRASPSLRNLAGSPPGADHPRLRRTRVAVKVQDGCDTRCAYCIVPDARGLPVSVPAADVVGQVAALAAQGTAEVVLTGVNIGKYRDGSIDLAGLVARIAATGIPRIRISSIEPLDLTPRLLETLAATPAVMHHLHVPLQSGSRRILDAMGRGYDPGGYTEAVHAARAALPALVLTTDVIVGFPGETETDHVDSMEFIEGLGFTRLHVFRYSRRAGTPAATMPGQIEPAVSAKRAVEARALGERLASVYACSRVGGGADVLVERVADGIATGTSEDYLTVHVRDLPDATRPGDVVRVRITASQRGAVWAVP